MSYTWLAFKNEVKTLLTVDKNRPGANEYIERMIRHGVIDVQSKIEAYKVGHEALYGLSDFVKEGCAFRAVFPPEATVRDVAIIITREPEDDEEAEDIADIRHPVSSIDWGRRNELVQGIACLPNNRTGLLALDPNNYTFYLYGPTEDQNWQLSLMWDGLKLEFEDEEETPFDEPLTLVVAEFVKAKIAREVNQNIAMHNSYMETYMHGRKNLYLNVIERRRVA